MSEEKRFSEWFEDRRRMTWMASLSPGEFGKPMPPGWSLGIRPFLWEGWLARAARTDRITGESP